MRISRLIFVAILMLIYTDAAQAVDVLQVSERQPGNFESWVALAILATSVFAAWFLNHRASKVRAFGTLLAAAGCFALAGWFLFFVAQTGFLENPKPNQTPMDAAKPVLLWLQSMAGLAAGLILLLAAYRQSKDTRSLELSTDNQQDHYGLVSRLLHWSIAILIIALIPMGIFTSMIPEGTPYRIEYYVVHKTIGVCVFILVLIRLFWNRVSRRPELDKSLKPTELKLAHVAHIGLYGMMFLIPITGFIMTTFHGAPTFFFAWQLDPLWGFSETGTIIWGVLHKYLLPYLLYIILGAHVMGALKHQFIDKHAGALKRMVS